MPHATLHLCALLTLLLALPVAAQTPEPEGDFVRLKNGRVYEGPVRIEGATARAARLAVDGQTFDWRTIVRARSGSRLLVNAGQVRRGEVREQLLVRVREGRLDLFAPYGTAELGSRPTHFSRGDGAVLPLDREHLRPVLAEVPQSVALLDRSRLYLRASNVMRAVAAFALFFDVTDRPGVQVASSFGLVGLSFAARGLAANRRHRAVELYLDRP